MFAEWKLSGSRPYKFCRTFIEMGNFPYCQALEGVSNLVVSFQLLPLYGPIWPVDGTRGCLEPSSRPDRLGQLLSKHCIQHGVRDVTHLSRDRSSKGRGHGGAWPLFRSLEQLLELTQDVGGLRALETAPAFGLLKANLKANSLQTSLFPCVAIHSTSNFPAPGTDTRPSSTRAGIQTCSCKRRAAAVPGHKSCKTFFGEARRRLSQAESRILSAHL